MSTWWQDEIYEKGHDSDMYLSQMKTYDRIEDGRLNT